MGDDERRALDALDDGGHRVGLAGAGDAQQHLAGHARLHACGERLDRLGLIALGLERGFEDKTAFLHGIPSWLASPGFSVHYSID